MRWGGNGIVIVDAYAASRNGRPIVAHIHGSVGGLGTIGPVALLSGIFNGGGQTAGRDLTGGTILIIQHDRFGVPIVGSVRLVA